MAEVKILNIDVNKLCSTLEKLGAKKVFDDVRVIIHFDYKDRRLMKSGETVKLTLEGKFKITYETKKEEIKFSVSRDVEAINFLSKLGLYPISKVKAKRISYEWNNIDFDIDSFPKIDSFMEVDADSKSLQNILKKLGLENHESVRLSTPEVYNKQGLDYFSLFRLR